MSQYNGSAFSYIRRILLRPWPACVQFHSIQLTICLIAWKYVKDLTWQINAAIFHRENS